jgi:hypothetical protein
MIALQVVRDEKPHIEQTFLVTAEIEAGYDVVQKMPCGCQSLRQLGLVNKPNFNTNAVSMNIPLNTGLAYYRISTTS